MPFRLEAFTVLDRRRLMGWGIFGVASFVLFLWLYPKAFVEASLKLEVTKDQATDRAQAFIQRQGGVVDGYRHTTTFTVDHEAKTFLERTLGIAGLNQLAQSFVHLWSWNCRWFRPLEKEEWSVEVALDGRVIGYDHEIPEERVTPSLSREEALARAIAFLRRGRGVNPSSFEWADEHVTTTPQGRKDYTFTWKDPYVKAGEAQYRYAVTIQGNEEGKFSEYLHVPEIWTQRFQEESQKGATVATVAWAVTGILTLGMLVMFFQAIRAGRVAWPVAWRMGGVIGVFAALAAVNDWPLLVAGFPTTLSWPAWLNQQVFDMILAGLGTGASLWVLSAAADALGRDAWPTQQGLGAPLTRMGRLSKAFAMSVAIGYAFAFFDLAAQSVFYLAGQHVGVWSPVEVPYDNMLSTAAPWIFPLFNASQASVGEELMFRIGGMAVCLRYFKRPWIAFIVPGVVWAFLHTTYPQQPFYIRGVEISLMALPYAWLVARTGIWTTLVAHFVFDALLMGLPLLRSPHVSQRGAAALVVCLPACALLPALWHMVRGTRLKTIAALAAREASEAPVAAPVVPEPVADLRRPDSRPVAPLPSRWATWLLIAVAAGGVGGWIAGLDRVFRWGPPDHRLSRTEIVERSRNAFEARVGSSRGWYHSETFAEEGSFYGDTFLARRWGSRRTYEWYARELAPLQRHRLWSVTWARPMSREKHTVLLGMNGEVVEYQPHLPEEAPGPSWSKADALALASAYAGRHGVDLSRYVLKDHLVLRHHKRTDHEVTWRLKDFEVDGATQHVHVSVAGKEAFGLNAYLGLPEAWERDEQAQPPYQVALAGCGQVGRLGVGILLAVWLVRLFVRGSFQWKMGIRLGGAAALVALVLQVNALPGFFHQLVWDSTVSVQQVWVHQLIAWGSSMATAGLTTMLLWVFADAALREQFPERPGAFEHLRGWRSSVDRPGARLALGWFLLASLSESFPGWQDLPLIMHDAWFRSAADAAVIVPSGPDVHAWWPAAGLLAGEVQAGLFRLPALALAACAAKKYLRTWWRVGAVLVGLEVFLALAGEKSLGLAGAFALEGSMGWLYRLALVAAVGHYAGLYAVLVVGGSLAASAWPLLQCPNLFYRLNGIVGLAAWVGIIVWLARRGWGRSDEGR